MKKLVLTMIAMVTMSLSAMAQDTAQVRRQFNPEQMAKMRTDATVQKYGLNEEQAKKLLDLNTRFADKIRPMGPMGGQRRGGQRMQGDRPQRMNPDSLRAQGQGQRVDPDSVVVSIARRCKRIWRPIIMS